MALKRYQVALLFFALGIFVVTLVFGYLIKEGYEEVVLKATPTPTSVIEERVRIKVFFSSTQEDPDTLYCDKTYPVEREVVLKGEMPQGRFGELTYLTIQELLDGPTEDEKMEGFFTSINQGTQVQVIAVEDGIATIDFNSKLNEGVAGSCLVQAIRAQITETLNQFIEVQDVIISVDGNIEEILQP